MKVMFHSNKLLLVSSDSTQVSTDAYHNAWRGIYVPPLPVKAKMSPVSVLFKNKIPQR